MNKFYLAAAVGFSVLAFGNAQVAEAQQSRTFPAGAAVEARFVSSAGYSPRGIYYYRPDFSVWLQVRTRMLAGEDNYGVGRVTGPTSSTPATISLTAGPGTIERGRVDAASGFHGRADDFRMLTNAPVAPVLAGTESPRSNGLAPWFPPNRAAVSSYYNNGVWSARTISRFDAIRSGAIIQNGTPVVAPASWSEILVNDGSWTPWQNVYLVNIAGLPANARFTISASAAASIMTGTLSVNAAGVYAVGASSTALRPFTAAQTFQFVPTIQPANNTGPLGVPQPAFAPMVIPAPAAAAFGTALVAVVVRRRR